MKIYIPGMKGNRESGILFILSFMQFAHIIDFMIIMPLGPQFMRIFHISPAQFGLLVSSYTFSAAVSGIFVALFVDRFARKTAIITVFSGLLIGTFFCAVAPDYYFLLTARIVAGAFGGILNALILAVIGDIFPEERRGRATGIVMSSFSIASILGIPVGLFLASMFSWHIPFLTIGILGIFIIPYALKVLPPINDHMTDHNKNPFLVLFNIVYSAKNATMLFFTFSLMMTVFSIVPYLSPFFVSNTGMKESELPLIYFFAGLFTFFTSRKIGHLSDKHGKHNIFIIVALLSNIPIFLLTNLTQSKIYTTIFVTTIFMILVSGRSVPGLALIAGSVEPKIRGGFLSINSSVQQLTAGIASLIAGMIIYQKSTGELMNYDVVGYIAIFFCLLSIAIVFWLKKNHVPFRHSH